jgi:hypothetical protein
VKSFRGKQMRGLILLLKMGVFAGIIEIGEKSQKA